MMTTTRCRKDRGFTLIELLVVMAIAGVVAGLVLPAVPRVRLAAEEAKARREYKQLAIAIINYQNSVDVDGIAIMDVLTAAAEGGELDALRVMQLRAAWNDTIDRLAEASTELHWTLQDVADPEDRQVLQVLKDEVDAELRAMQTVSTQLESLEMVADMRLTAAQQSDVSASLDEIMKASPQFGD